MVSKLTQEKKLSQATVSNIISLFDHLSEAHAHMLMGVPNLSCTWENNRSSYIQDHSPCQHTPDGTAVNP